MKNQADGGKDVIQSSPQAIMDEIAALDKARAEVLGDIVQRLETGTRRTT